MTEEKKKVLKMLSDGIITVDEAEQLLTSIQVGKMKEEKKDPEEKSLLKRFVGRFLYVEIASKDQDYVNITLPISLLKVAIKIGNIESLINNALNKSAITDEEIDIDLIINAIEENLIGDIMNIKSKDGDIIKIYIK